MTGNLEHMVVGLHKLLGRTAVEMYKGRRARSNHAECFAEGMRALAALFDRAQSHGAPPELGAIFQDWSHRIPALGWADDAVALGRELRVWLNVAVFQSYFKKAGIEATASPALTRETQALLARHTPLTPDAVSTLLHELARHTHDVLWDHARTQGLDALEQAQDIAFPDFFGPQYDRWQAIPAGDRIEPGPSITNWHAATVSARTWEAVKTFVLTQLEAALEPLHAVHADVQQIQALSHILRQPGYRGHHSFADLASELKQLQQSEAWETCASQAHPIWHVLAHNELDQLHQAHLQLEALSHWQPDHIHLEGIERFIEHTLRPVWHAERKQYAAGIPPSWWRLPHHQLCVWERLIACRSLIMMVLGLASLVFVATGHGVPSLVCQGLILLGHGAVLYRQLQNDASDRAINRAYRMSHTSEEKEEPSCHDTPFDEVFPRHAALNMLSEPPQTCPSKRPNALIGLDSTSSCARCLDKCLTWVNKALVDTLHAFRIAGIHLTLNGLHQALGVATAAASWISSSYFMVQAIQRYRRDMRRHRSRLNTSRRRRSYVAHQRLVLYCQITIWLADSLIAAATCYLVCHTAALSLPMLLIITSTRLGCKVLKERAKVTIDAQRTRQSSPRRNTSPHLDDLQTAHHSNVPTHHVRQTEWV